MPLRHRLECSDYSDSSRSSFVILCSDKEELLADHNGPDASCWDHRPFIVVRNEESLPRLLAHQDLVLYR